MKKIVSVSVSVSALAVVGVALAAPAQADDDSNVLGPVGAADDWNFATVDGVPETSGQEIAKVPALAPYIGNQKSGAAGGNVLDHVSP
ncbi:hypothetical protein [Streptomyces sp. NPDC059168]|uniref:hypothetical protein n=1 Tax=Streptomyces sp. NPDC059168 TaxID=3346753 RepID=UPI003692A14D